MPAYTLRPAPVETGRTTASPPPWRYSVHPPLSSFAREVETRRPDYRLPNLYVGTLSMASVRSALSSGISANQIVSYLQHNAHPHVAKRIPVVPETVSDQVR